MSLSQERDQEGGEVPGGAGEQRFRAPETHAETHLSDPRSALILQQDIADFICVHVCSC